MRIGGVALLISTKGRYALRVLIDLAENGGDAPVTLKAIALRQGISEKYLEAVVKSLVQEKIIKGTRGKGGGYFLAVPPEELSIGKILRLTEPGLGTVSCLASDYSCPRADSCPTLPFWRELDSLILDFLDSRLLVSLVKDGADKGKGADAPNGDGDGA